MRYAGRPSAPPPLRPSALPPAHDLPAIDYLPKLQSLRFGKATGEMKTKDTKGEQKADYESVGYRVNDVGFRAAPSPVGTSEVGS